MNRTIPRTLLTVGLLAALGGSLAFLAVADDKKPKGEKYALLVGVRKYNPNELRSLPYAEADVDELAKVLQASGYAADNVRLMTQKIGADEPRFAPTKANIEKELRGILRNRDEADSILIAFAGHGVQFAGNEENYFCPSDAKLSDKETLVPLGTLYDDLGKCEARFKLLLVDACRNNPQSDNSRARAEVALESVTRPMRKLPPGGVAAFFSCSAGEKAFEHEELKHGVFFHFVIQGLRGGDSRYSTVDEKTGRIEMDDLIGYVRKRVPDFVQAKYGADVEQKPEFVSKISGSVALVTVERDKPTVPPSTIPGDVVIITNSIGMKLALIPAGEFMMGTPDRVNEALSDDEKPQHKVRITPSFHMGIHEVTIGQFRKFVEAASYDTDAEKDGEGGRGYDADANEFTQRNPKYHWKNTGWPQSDEHPVVNVSWNDAIAFCKWLSKKEGKIYRLPTEAEWEYACRANSKTKHFFGDDVEDMAAYGNIADGTHKVQLGAWVTYNTIRAKDGYTFTAPVGKFKANAFGLYDIHGNAGEWCSDWYDEKFYTRSPIENPEGPSDGKGRVLRGASFADYPEYARTAFRHRFEPTYRSNHIGFRLVLASAASSPMK